MSEKLPPKILVIEDDERLRASISNNIERSNLDVIRANSKNVLSAIGTDTPNLAIIADHDGNNQAVSIAKMLWEKYSEPTLPLIFIAENAAKNEQYSSLSSQFVVSVNKKDLSLELLPSIKLLLRKSKPVFQNKTLSFRNITIDLATFRVTRDGEKIHLGPTEFKILHLLMQSPDKIFSREEIINFVWDNPRGDIEPRTVDVHVNRLRSMLKAYDREVSIIKTIRSAGYCLKLPGEID